MLQIFHTVGSLTGYFGCCVHMCVCVCVVLCVSVFVCETEGESEDK